MARGWSTVNTRIDRSLFDSEIQIEDDRTTFCSFSVQQSPDHAQQEQRARGQERPRTRGHEARYTRHDDEGVEGG